MMEPLDKKLNDVFTGKVVRKDLVHQIKKAANVPSFVLEFLLSKYCATDDPAEIEAGKRAVLEVIEKNYVRPDESNSAQSKVHQQGRHKFIDKVHVKYHEKERRHWAEMENFGSRRIAVNEKFYKENEKLLEGGMWSEVIVAHNEVEEDKYAFYIEDLRPIQLSRFNESVYFEGRNQFTRDEWIDVILRSVGLNPEIMDNPPPEIKANFPSGFRLKMHFISRLMPLVQQNFNFLELGPRGTGKSYFYSEFSPYSTLLSGGQASTATLLYNNARKKVGAVGFWDNIAFDEVGNVRIKDTDTIQIMKDYMANGRFSRGQEVIANASFSFVGNIDQSIDQLVNSYDHNLFITLPKSFDLAIQDRFFFFLAGWEIPKMDNKFFTERYGLITDYMAEAFHYMFKHNKDYIDIVNNRLRLGSSVQGRDELAIKKSVSALIKILHPDGNLSDEEFYQLVEYAIEGRRRVKEQMNKIKPDDEFALINLSYFKVDGTEVVVYCPESRSSPATQNPRDEIIVINKELNLEVREIISVKDDAKVTERRIKILYGDTGYSYYTLFKDYLANSTMVILEDSYIRQKHQISNLIRFCELLVKTESIRKFTLITGFDDEQQKNNNQVIFAQIADNLFEHDLEFRFEFSTVLHDREIRIDNGWCIKMGRGLDFYQSLAGNYYQIGVNDLDLRPCLECSFDFYKI